MMSLHWVTLAHYFTIPIQRADTKKVYYHKQSIHSTRINVYSICWFLHIYECPEGSKKKTRGKDLLFTRDASHWLFFFQLASILRSTRCGARHRSLPSNLLDSGIMKLRFDEQWMIFARVYIYIYIYINLKKCVYILLLVLLIIIYHCYHYYLIYQQSVTWKYEIFYPPSLWTITAWAGHTCTGEFLPVSLNCSLICWGMKGFAKQSISSIHLDHNILITKTWSWDWPCYPSRFYNSKENIFKEKNTPVLKGATFQHWPPRPPPTAPAWFFHWHQQLIMLLWWQSPAVAPWCPA